VLFTPGGATTYPDALTFNASGLPTGAAAIFSPATVADGSAATPVTLTIQTSSQAARTEKAASGQILGAGRARVHSATVGGHKSARHRQRQMPLPLALTVLSLGTRTWPDRVRLPSTLPVTYTIVITATDTTINAHTQSTSLSTCSKEPQEQTADLGLALDRGCSMSMYVSSEEK
jgi:hypothetical protein